MPRAISTALLVFPMLRRKFNLGVESCYLLYFRIPARCWMSAGIRVSDFTDYPYYVVLKPRSRMSWDSSTCDSRLSCCAILLDLSHSYWVFLLPANFNGITGQRRSWRDGPVATKPRAARGLRNGRRSNLRKHSRARVSCSHGPLAVPGYQRRAETG